MAGVSIKVNTGVLAQPASITTIKANASTVVAGLAAVALPGKGFKGISVVKIHIFLIARVTCI